MSTEVGIAAFLSYVAEMHRAVHAIGSFLDARFGGDVSQPEALILIHLAGRPASTINALHHAFLHRRSTLTSVLDRMETKGLVERRAMGDDRRSVGVKLTPKGARTARAVVRALGELQAGGTPALAVGPQDVARVRTLAARASAAAAGVPEA